MANGGFAVAGQDNPIGKALGRLSAQRQQARDLQTRFLISELSFQRAQQERARLEQEERATESAKSIGDLVSAGEDPSQAINEFQTSLLGTGDPTAVERGLQALTREVQSGQARRSVAEQAEQRQLEREQRVEERALAREERGVSRAIEAEERRFRNELRRFAVENGLPSFVAEDENELRAAMLDKRIATETVQQSRQREEATRRTRTRIDKLNKDFEDSGVGDPFDDDQFTNRFISELNGLDPNTRLIPLPVTLSKGFFGIGEKRAIMAANGSQVAAWVRQELKPQLDAGNENAQKLKLAIDDLFQRKQIHAFEVARDTLGNEELLAVGLNPVAAAPEPEPEPLTPTEETAARAERDRRIKELRRVARDRRRPAPERRAAQDELREIQEGGEGALGRFLSSAGQAGLRLGAGLGGATGLSNALQQLQAPPGTGTRSPQRLSERGR